MNQNLRQSVCVRARGAGDWGQESRAKYILVNIDHEFKKSEKNRNENITNHHPNPPLPSNLPLHPGKTLQFWL